MRPAASIVFKSMTATPFPDATCLRPVWLHENTCGATAKGVQLTVAQ